MCKFQSRANMPTKSITNLPTWLIVVAAIAISAILQTVLGTIGSALVTGAAIGLLYTRWHDQPAWKGLVYAMCIGVIIGLAASFICNLHGFTDGFAQGFAQFSHGK
jgi:hypothetical protein